MNAPEPTPLCLDRDVDPASLAWVKMNGLLPAIVQHAHTGTVLMVGYMNLDALRATLASRRVTFFSRGRGALWTKGETSGHYLDATGVTCDCDADALLVRAIPHGPVCHTGAPDCFMPQAGDPPLAILATLQSLLPQRIAAGPAASYTARLTAGGVRRVAQKVGEEGVEVALASVAEDDAALTGEAADLLYHLAVLLHVRGLSLFTVARELERRHRAAASLAPDPP